MSAIQALSYQPRRFSLGYFFEQYKEGWLMIYGECLKRWCERRAKRGAPKATASTNYVASLDQPEKANKVSWDWRNELEKRDGEFEMSVAADGEQASGTLTYGLGCLAKMFHVMFLYGPGFVFDARPGLLPSRLFMICYYITILVSILVGLCVAKLILEPTLINVLPGLVKSIIQLLAFTTTSSEYLLIIYGMGSILVVVQNRRYVQEFVLYHCNIISLPKSFQRRKAVELFLSHYILAMLSKPLFISLTVICDPEQPIHLKHWSPVAFALARAFSIAITSLGSLLICTSGMVVPYTSTFLIVCSAGHLNNFLHKHLARFDHTTNKLLDLDEPQNVCMDELLDERTRQVISDYSCDTITQDWPRLMCGELEEEDSDGEEEEEADKWQQSHATSQSSSVRASESIRAQATNIRAQFSSIFGACLGGHQKRLLAERPILSELRVGPAEHKIWTCRSATRAELEESRQNPQAEMGRLLCTEAAQYNSAANSLLFLYKNLIKSMSELKGMIAIYERKFGTFHLIQICIDSLIVAQYITAALTESRLRTESKSGPGDNLRSANTSGFEVAELATRAEITPLAIEATIGVLSFIISNIYIFMRCDCLPDCMAKMRSKLFKMNVELARSALRPHAHLSSQTGSGQSLSGPARRSTLAVTVGSESACWLPRRQTSGRRSMQGKSLELFAAEECAELDQVWCLYDQVERMSELANFRLTAGTYYSKRCLLWIFGRTVSLTLLCIQIVDIYSYT